ncbi:hypothetical protein J3R30DRAFT_1069918 [Lentinula aciculospora]|uniref:Uncharacterized protein n=1 Tax=Lentinula aciculospora TaxID=153920 RepID=A0A9W9DIL3_9AGAR|nr:hypothetical protein J3R30DRAFT_1069918 [Lentinula aciculospora]
MSTSRRSSQSTRSTVTARSNRPPTWRATSLIATVPGPPLIVSKNSSAPEVSMVTAEPETISASASAASQLAPTIPKGSRLISSSSVDGRLRAERRNSTKTRLQDVFPTEDSGEGGSNTEAGASFPSGSKVDTDPNVVSPSTSSPALLESTDENDQPFPSTSAETTPVLHIPPVQPEHEPLSSSSPNQASWFGSFGRSKAHLQEMRGLSMLRV